MSLYRSLPGITNINSQCFIEYCNVIVSGFTYQSSIITGLYSSSSGIRISSSKEYHYNINTGMSKWDTHIITLTHTLSSTISTASSMNNGRGHCRITTIMVIILGNHHCNGGEFLLFTVHWPSSSAVNTFIQCHHRGQMPTAGQINNIISL